MTENFEIMQGMLETLSAKPVGAIDTKDRPTVNTITETTTDRSAVEIIKQTKNNSNPPREDINHTKVMAQTPTSTPANNM